MWIGSGAPETSQALLSGSYGCHSSGHIAHIAPHQPPVTTDHFSWVSHWGLSEPVQVPVTLSWKTNPWSFPFSLWTLSRALSCPHKDLLEASLLWLSPPSGCQTPPELGRAKPEPQPADGGNRPLHQQDPPSKALGDGIRSCHREGLQRPYSSSHHSWIPPRPLITKARVGRSSINYL